MTNVKSLRTGSDRQKEFISRQKDKGYSLLTACWVPTSQVAAIRAKVKEMVEDFERQINIDL